MCYNMELRAASQEIEYSEELPTCRHRKLQPAPEDHHAALMPSTQCVTPMRIDYFRVMCALAFSVLLMGVSYMYYNSFVHVLETSDTTDTLLFNPKGYQGDLLVVSLRVQLHGVAASENQQQTEILIPIDSLRPQGKDSNFSFNISSK
jgi:hypothetical protein